jgi:hypothetical protein
MKRLLQHILLILLIGLPFVSCSEIFVPEVDQNREALVVQGLITDGAGPFCIILSKARPYNSDSTVKSTYVSNAVLNVTDSEGQTFGLTYQADGKYWLPDSFRAVAGRSYVLHITTGNGEVYESDPQKLMASETIDTLYNTFVTKDYLNSFGELKSVGGYDIRVDLFKNATAPNPKPLCRFESNIVVQYLFTQEQIDPTNPAGQNWYWFIFGWGTYNLNETANITDERAKTDSAEIKDHLLCFMPKDPNIYGISSYPTMSTIYYFRYKQYTINEDTYRFYVEANKQLSATGKMFDPITSQLIGNMHCTSNTSSIVLGLFEVSSVQQAAYFIRRTAVKSIYTDNIPDSGGAYYKVYKDGHATDDPEFQVIPFPSWWSHTR